MKKFWVSKKNKEILELISSSNKDFDKLKQKIKIIFELENKYEFYSSIKEEIFEKIF